LNLSGLPVFTVTQVNRHIKTMMDGDELLSGLLVRGEISNYKCYPSGHHYFSLKDPEGTLRCVMFRGDATRLRFRPSNGQKVVAFGQISVFPRDGQYQLYCRDLLADGAGDLNAAFEQLKAKLEKEGLFDPARKKMLPDVPARIALVTSPAGAAVRDMIRILGARWPLSEIIIVPVRVQGEGAAAEIAAGIRRVNAENLADLIITGRGGGSMEDLWAFNEEIVARAIFDSKIPIISAVGHEPDVTIADYVADLRAATPSNGAELAVPDQNEIKLKLEQLHRRMVRAELGTLSRHSQRLSYLKNSRALKNIRTPIEEKRLILDHQQRRLDTAFQSRLTACRVKLAQLSASLDALSPLRVLGRGYAIPVKGNSLIASVHQVEVGDSLDLSLSDGVLTCTVTEKEPKKHG